MRIDAEVKLDYKDVLLRPKRSNLKSRKDVRVERTFTFYHSPKKWVGIPIMTANMATCGTFELAKILSKHKIITTFHKFYSVSDYKEFFKDFDNHDYIVYSLGIRDGDFEKLKEMKKENLLDKFSFICLDVPNGYISIFLEKIRELRKICPNHIIIAGNVVTNEMTEEIILNGADIVKIGIGPASACTTRLMTGVGFPQLSAVVECADAAHGLSSKTGSGLVIADGGQQYPSCIVKAFCAGGDFNMFGSMFSGYAQSGGELVEKDGKKYKSYFGTSSNKSMKEFYGKKELHRASEGREVLLPYKGDGFEDFLQDMLGSIRSAGTYIGASKLKEISKRATFVRVNRQLSDYLSKYDTEKRF